LGFGPGFRGDVFDLPVGHLWQAGEDIAQVSVRIKPAPAATLHQRVKDRSAFTGCDRPDEEPSENNAEGGAAIGMMDGDWHGAGEGQSTSYFSKANPPKLTDTGDDFAFESQRDSV